MNKTEIQELPQIKDRMTFLYVEHCTVGRDNGAITMTDERGIIAVPVASLSVLMLGPGTRVTHRAMELAGEMGLTVIWVGEHGVKYYASGRPLTHRAGLLIKQAELVSNQRKRLDVVKKMYEMRFPGEDVTKMTLQQLRGREGSRIRTVYKNAAEKWGVEWNGRVFSPDDFAGGDAVNQALSAGNACLYGLAHAVITALGCSAGLGFVHAGHENSFVYDIADLYKAEIVIPLAFEVASEKHEEVGSEMRRRVRDIMSKGHLIERMVRDIRKLIQGSEGEDENDVAALYLWDDKKGSVPYGTDHSKT